jgi:general secretion pathway protein I
MKVNRKPRRGISLLEVLLAMAIFLMSLAAIGQLVDMGSNDALAATAQAAGTRLAQSKLAEVEAGAISGTCDTEPEWSWTIASEATEVTSVYAVTATLTRTVRGRAVTVTLTQMIMDPQAMGGAEEAQKPTATTGSTTP